MNTQNAIQFYPECNVTVKVGSLQPDGTIKIRDTRFFRNTGTAFLTTSLVAFLSGSVYDYDKRRGRPNYVGFGTSGIVEQRNFNSAVLESGYSNLNPDPTVRTRPWYDSTSLGQTTLESDFIGYFWNPTYGWGTTESPDIPCFQGELCTDNTVDNPIHRVPIIDSNITSACPEDLDYGDDGYMSEVRFFAMTPPDWSAPFFNTESPKLDRIAISEFGLYEQDSTDSCGLYTMLAGFRVPADSIVYVTPTDIILVEWLIRIQALMPNQQVKTKPGVPNTYSISLSANSPAAKQIQFSGEVSGDASPISWSLSNQTSAQTRVTDTGLVTLGTDENSEIIYVTGKSELNTAVAATTGIIPDLLDDYISAVRLTVHAIDYQTIQYSATVLGKGEYLDLVNWRLEGNESSNTILTQNGLLTISSEESAQTLTVVAVAVGSPTVTASSKVILNSQPYQLNLVSFPVVCNAGATIGSISVHSTRTSSAGKVVAQITITPTDSGAFTMTVLKNNAIVAADTKIGTQGIDLRLECESPVSVSNTSSLFEVIVTGPGNANSGVAYVWAPNLVIENA